VMSDMERVEALRATSLQDKFICRRVFGIYVSLRVEKNILIMSTEMMSNMLAEYFKTKPVLKAWLFGSFARGEETSQSDVDILIVLDHSQTVGMDFFGMYEELKELLGRNVDLVTERSLAPFARKSVEQDRKLVYERTA